MTDPLPIHQANFHAQLPIGRGLLCGSSIRYQSVPIWDLTGTVQIVDQQCKTNLLFRQQFHAHHKSTNTMPIQSITKPTIQCQLWPTLQFQSKTNPQIQDQSTNASPGLAKQRLKFRTYLSPTVWSIRKDNQKRTTTKGEGHPKGGAQPKQSW